MQASLRGRHSSLSVAAAERSIQSRQESSYDTVPVPVELRGRSALIVERHRRREKHSTSARRRSKLTKKKQIKKKQIKKKQIKKKQIKKKQLFASTLK